MGGVGYQGCCGGAVLPEDFIFRREKRNGSEEMIFWDLRSRSGELRSVGRLCNQLLNCCFPPLLRYDMADISPIIIHSGPPQASGAPMNHQHGLDSSVTPTSGVLAVGFRLACLNVFRQQRLSTQFGPGADPRNLPTHSERFAILQEPSRVVDLLGPRSNAPYGQKVNGVSTLGCQVQHLYLFRSPSKRQVKRA